MNKICVSNPNLIIFATIQDIINKQIKRKVAKTQRERNLFSRPFKCENLCTKYFEFCIQGDGNNTTLLAYLFAPLCLSV